LSKIQGKLVHKSGRGEKAKGKDTRYFGAALSFQARSEGEHVEVLIKNDTLDPALKGDRDDVAEISV
jgi:hypothetical protein